MGYERCLSPRFCLTDYRFGVEFAWQVVETDGCVRRLVVRIGEAKKALRPFEGSSAG
jgi:hypothetical protein